MKDTIVSLDPNQVIILTERYRKDLGAVAELAASIKEHGQHVPIIVKRTEDGKDVLIAGERRTRACMQLNIPVRATYKLGDVNDKVIEIIENLHRKQFDWREEVQATKDLHDFVKGAKVASGHTDVSLREVAAEVGFSPGHMSKAVNLADAVQATPEIFKGCNSKSEAYKVLQKARIDELTAEIAKRHANKGTNVGQKLLFQGNCVELIKSLPPRSIAGLLSDPAYGIDIDQTKKSDFKVDDIYKDDHHDYRKTMEDFALNADRALSEDSFICMFCGTQHFDWLNKLWAGYGFRMATVPGIWVRGGGQTMQPNYYFGSSYEMFVYGTRGNALLIKPGVSNVITMSGVPVADKLHPVQKPLALMEELLTRFALPGQTVVDFMAGSGTTIVAGVKRGIRVLGFELDPQRIDPATVRITEAQKMKNAGLGDQIV